MEATPLASLSLTHVHYNPDDPISYLCAWLALVPQALCVIYVTLIYSSREVEVLMMAIGQFVCEVLNFVLKRVIKEERPPQMNGKGYGMPSSHAQFLSYFAVSLTFFLLARHKPKHPQPTQTFFTIQNLLDPAVYQNPFSFLERFVLSLSVILLAGAVGWSRVYLEYHTPTQVTVGSFAGAAIATAWYLLTSWLRSSGWVTWGCGTWLGQAGRWRDLVLQQDLPEAGWRQWCAEGAEKGSRSVANGTRAQNKKTR